MEGWNLFAYPFSSCMGLNDTDLASDGAHAGASTNDADIVQQAIGEIAFTEYRKYWLTNSVNMWLDTEGATAEVLLQAGHGYWYRRRDTNTFGWSEIRPYSDPFTSGSGVPHVFDMIVDDQNDELTLTIQPAGVSNKLLEIYYQDLFFTNAFCSTSGWVIATTGINTDGQSLTNWTDAGSASRPCISAVDLRYYLVARGDADIDLDGLPDAREIFIHHTNPSDYDTDDDGVSDGNEIARQTDPNDGDDVNAVLYVDNLIGSNSFDGYAPAISGGHGPKSNIWAAIDIAISGDVVELAQGLYEEATLSVGTNTLTLHTTGIATLK